MIVKQLIKELQKYPPNMTVSVEQTEVITYSEYTTDTNVFPIHIEEVKKEDNPKCIVIKGHLYDKVK